MDSGVLNNYEATGISEVQWPGSGTQKTDDGYLYYSGRTDGEHRYGVAVVMTSAEARSVLDFVPLIDSAMPI
ncbi:hypothetical protein HUJ04_001449 [Dendroctonus ponderosae]|nr:hypothetical protein HUJ04_001449 [Dendroctonus ponderosae]